MAPKVTRREFLTLAAGATALGLGAGIVLVRFLRERRCADGFCAAPARRRAVRHRRRADDGEPVVRPHARLAARRRTAGRRAHLRRQGRRAHETWPLAPDFQGCHTRTRTTLGRASRPVRRRALRRFLKTQPIGDLFPIGYYARTTCRSSARWPRATRPSTTTSARCWARPGRTGSTSSPRPPTSTWPTRLSRDRTSAARAPRDRDLRPPARGRPDRAATTTTASR